MIPGTVRTIEVSLTLTGTIYATDDNNNDNILTVPTRQYPFLLGTESSSLGDYLVTLNGVYFVYNQPLNEWRVRASLCYIDPSVPNPYLGSIRYKINYYTTTYG